MGALTSWPKYLPKTPPTNTISSGIRISTYEFWRNYKYSDYSSQYIVLCSPRLEYMSTGNKTYKYEWPYSSSLVLPLPTTLDPVDLAVCVPRERMLPPGDTAKVSSNMNAQQVQKGVTILAGISGPDHQEETELMFHSGPERVCLALRWSSWFLLLHPSPVLTLNEQVQRPWPEKSLITGICSRMMVWVTPPPPR